LENREIRDWIVIVNPNAGVGKCGRDWNRISKLLAEANLDFETVFTERRKHATHLVIQAIKQGYRKVISVGGDGTLNEVVNGILEQNTIPSKKISLGVVSVGTGNDWIRTYKIPSDYKKSIEIIQQEHTFIQDTGKVTYATDNGVESRFFVNMAGLGFDGLVAQKTNADKEAGKSNPFVYFYHIFFVNSLPSIRILQSTE
jgi:diacylglycerol kinase family enzyme